MVFRHLDLFSGIGGFSLGLERCKRFKTIAFCEQDEYCRSILRKHWPDVPIYQDVETFPTEEVSDVDIITGGYPCQPFSVASRYQQGTSDDRHLWPYMLKIVRQTRPTYIVAENVTGHVQLGLDEVLHDLEGEGYTTRTVIIPACGVDAPHLRKRLWILAYTNYSRQSSGSRDWQPRNNIGRSSESERGYKWPDEPNVPRVAHGIPNRLDRIRVLGNSLIPKIVEVIGEGICQHSDYSRTPSKIDS